MSGRPAAIAALAAITIAGAAVRFFGLSWGAPYYHFHIDEHFVFSGADLLRRSPHDAAMSPKFFMYSPLPMYLLIGLRETYERLVHPLVLSVKHDEIVFMVLGRAISATLGTATIPLVYLIARRLAGRTAGILAALLLALGVLHLRESHFFTVDISLTFFSVLTWWCLIRFTESGRMRWYIAAGVCVGAAIACKYTAVFLTLLAAMAYLCAPGRPARRDRPVAWIRWAARGTVLLVVAVVAFLALDPLVVLYHGKFLDDFRTLVVEPLSGTTTAIWSAHFTGIQPQLYWVTTILPWGIGPAFEIAGLIGLIWLIARRTRASLVAAAFPLAYFAFAGRTVIPFARYGVPLVPGLAVAAGVLCADLLRRPKTRVAALLATGLVVVTTAGYAQAYLHIYAATDSRLAAAAYLAHNVRADTPVLVEPSHNIPPMGSYLTAPDFNRDYVLWGRDAERHDYFRLFGLDTYRFLYNGRVAPDEKRAYVARRLAAAEYIVIDDTYVQFYQHLPASEHGVVKQYYEDLFAGRLGFKLVRTFKVYPALFGYEINDDNAELTFRLFDHPRVFIFKRTPARAGEVAPGMAAVASPGD